MVNIIINGFRGRMGTVLRELIERTDGLRVVAGVDPLVQEEESGDIPVYASLKEVNEKADVVIDFSNPEGIENLLDHVAAKNLPIVIATTGLNETQQAAVVACSKKVPVLQAANMSLGINVLKRLVKDTAAVLGRNFDIEIVERHHRMKRDAPSGTALVLAEAIRDTIDAPRELQFGRSGRDAARSDTEIGVHALRGGTIVGEHDVLFVGNDELLCLGHKAYSRGLFASGALKAAQYLTRKAPGLYGMEDLVSESTAVTHIYSSDEVLISFENVPAIPQASYDVFQSFAAEGISIDMISQTAGDNNTHSLSFSVSRGDTDTVTDIVNRLRDGSASVKGMVTSGLKKITVEGIGMELLSGVAARIFGILSELNVESKAVTTSETKIACLVKEDASEAVVAAIKKEFDI